MPVPQGLGFDDKVADGAGEEVGFVACVRGVWVGDSSGGEFGAEEGADALVGHFGAGGWVPCSENGYNRFVGE